MEKMKIHSEDRRDKTLKNVPDSIPMKMLNEEQAITNHGQTLNRLNERGGLGILEILDNIHKCSLSWRIQTQADVDELNTLINNWGEAALLSVAVK